MKKTDIVLISVVLLSMLGITVVDAAPHSQGTPSVQAATTAVLTVQRGGMAPPPWTTPPTSITLTTSDSTPHVGQTFTLSGTFALSNCSLPPGFIALELYRSVDDGGYKLFCTLTTYADGTFTKNLTYNTAATLKYYAVLDPTAGYGGSKSNIVTVTVTKAT